MVVHYEKPDTRGQVPLCRPKIKRGVYLCRFLQNVTCKRCVKILQKG